MSDAECAHVLRGTIFSEETLTATLVSSATLTGKLVMPEIVEIPVIPSNYGLITWNGSVLTVS